MISRRTFVGVASGLSAAALVNPAKLLGQTPVSPGDPTSAANLTQHVNLSIGTGGHGHTYPGATVPFGMVQLSPDTYTTGWDWCSGYHNSDQSLMGFSHTHLSGTGIGDLLDFLIMPGTGSPKLSPGTREKPELGYRSRFSHGDEVARPGYYAVLLRDYNVRAELSATERAGIHRYTFPKSETSHFILDLTHVSGGNPQAVTWSQLKVIGNDTLAGARRTSVWAHGREVFFYMKFSRPFSRAELLSNDRVLTGTRETTGTSLKSLVHFNTAENEAVAVKTGISGVSIEGAQRNLEAEIPHWNFDAVRHSAEAAWQHELSKIRIETSNRKHRGIFYTALYHAMCAPTLFDDVNGQYRGMDGVNHQLKNGRHNYSTFSLWDTYRAAHPLYTLFQSERVPDLVNCLIRMSIESPAGVPVWPLYAKETGTMSGYHSVVVIAEAIAKGFQGIDAAAAYGPMKRRVMHDDYRGLNLYRKFGYIPCDRKEESVSRSLDYAYDDWAVARVAEAAGAADDAKLLRERSKNYRNLFDRKSNFIRPRLENGAWAEPFDPKEISIMKKWRDFTESNAWQATFANQHDLKGYIALFGGREAFLKQLDALFTQSTDLPPDTPPDVAGLVGMYAHGNEPSHHIAYLYSYAGAPYKTQERVRSLLETMYHDAPDGMAGNEDCGQMSAWYVMSALGFYAVDPVSGNYVFGTPLFDRATITLGPDKKLVIEARRTAPEDLYIQAITFNGNPYDKTWFRHADIVNGGTILFHMGSKPNTQFGSEESAAPPSLTS